MKQKLFLITILLVLVLPVKQALANQPVNITDSVDSYPLGLYLDILEDKTGKLTFEDIQKPEYANKFVRSKEKVPNYGFSASAFWFKFSLKNIMTRDEELILELDYPLHEKIDLYISQPDKKFTVKHCGILLPFNQRDIEHRNPLFKIPLLRGEVDVIYLRVETEKGVQFPLTLWKTRSFWKNEQTAIYLFGAFFGILFVMLLYNSIIYISIKDNNYLFYVLYLFFQIFYQLFRTGLLYQYLWPNQIAFNQIAYPVSQLCKRPSGKSWN